jgi:hypothetical protein
MFAPMGGIFSFSPIGSKSGAFFGDFRKWAARIFVV